MDNGGRGRGSGGGGNSAECDVGLGLKMQISDSYSSPSPHHPYHEWNDRFMVMGGGGSGSGSGYGHGGYTSCYDSGCGSHVNDSRATPSPGFLSTSVDASGKGFFTANQWQELERQTNICKYMMAQIPVPPHLLSTSHVPLSKSNSGGLDLRFSSGSDAEPWRCRRTDGKKWRCSRDVAPDHKYCERHSHKNRPRSRKPVELHSHSGDRKNNYPSPSSSLQSCHKPVPQLPNMVSATTYPRYSEWFMKTGGSGTTSTNQQVQELLQSSAGLGRGTASKRDKNECVFQQSYEEGSGSSSIPFAAAARQHLSGTSIGNNCSLTLSMQSGGNIGFEQDNQNYSIVPVPHTPSAAWMAAPGGPLGEALCLGIASNTTTTSTSYEDGLHALNFIR